MTKNSETKLLAGRWANASRLTVTMPISWCNLGRGQTRSSQVYTQSWLERQADVERLKHAHAKSLSGATNLVQYWCNWYARRSSTAYDNIAVFADFVTSMLVAFAVQSLATLATRHSVGQCRRLTPRSVSSNRVRTAPALISWPWRPDPRCVRAVFYVHVAYVSNSSAVRVRISKVAIYARG